MPRSRCGRAVEVATSPERIVRNKIASPPPEVEVAKRDLPDLVDLVKMKGAVLGFSPDHPLRILVMALPDQLSRAEFNALIPVLIRLSYR